MNNLGLNFTAVDFETASFEPASVCAVGLVKVRDGVVAERASWFVQPPTGTSIHDFDPQQMAKHGIGPQDVADAATWEPSLARIQEFAGSDVLVAHDASFSQKILEQASSYSGFTPIPLTWRCSMNLAQRLLDLPVAGLEAAAVSLGVTGIDHEELSAEAEMTAWVVLSIAQQFGMSSVDELWPEKTPDNRRNSRLRTADAAYGQQPGPDPAHPLFGQHVAILEEPEKISLREAEELIIEFGGIFENSITPETTMLVLPQDEARSPEAALHYGSEEQQIQLLGEEEFLQLLDPNSAMPAEDHEAAQRKSRAPELGALFQSPPAPRQTTISEEAFAADAPVHAIEHPNYQEHEKLQRSIRVGGGALLIVVAVAMLILGIATIGQGDVVIGLFCLVVMAMAGLFSFKLFQRPLKW